MSEQMNRPEFENLMDEYLRGELNASDTRKFEQYVAHHPEVCEELAAIDQIVKITNDAAPLFPSEDLILKASTSTHLELSSLNAEKKPWYKRPGFTWSLAASLLLIIGLTIWPTDATFVYARLIDSLRTVESIQVRGWIRDENGVRVPYSQWVLKDGSLRADIGSQNHRRSVVVRANKRFIKDYDGQLYADYSQTKPSSNLGQVMDLLVATYQNPTIAQASFKYAKEDLGQSIRYQRQDYASLGQAPSDMKWIMEVDKESALPTFLELHQKIEGHWIQISHLEFVDFNIPPGSELFHLPGNVTHLNEQMKQEFWFELHITPASIFQPALFVPDGGIQVKWLTKKDMPEGISSGVSFLSAGGMTINEYRSISLREVVKSLSHRNVEDNEKAQTLVSLVITAKTNLPWEKKLETVLDPLDFRYTTSSDSTTRRHYIFEQNGSRIKPTEYRFSTFSVNADSSGYHYHFEKTALQRLALTMMMNCDHLESFTENDTIEFLWNGDSEENPFETFVDFDGRIAEATFLANADFLEEKFGLEMRMEKENFIRQTISLIQK